MGSVRLALLVLAGVACQPPVDRPAPSGKVRVRVFTETSPVRLLASAGKFVFVATGGDLERWDTEGRVFPMSGHGTQIVALAPDVDRRWVWILTESGLGHYDVGADVYQPLMPPASLGIEFALLAIEGASIAPSAEGGVWLGTAHGLVQVAPDGSWSATGLTAPVNAVARDGAGWLWVATKSGLVGRKPTGETIAVGAAEGCTIVDPRLLVELPDERMLVIGADESGRDRMAIGKELAWTTYRALPDVKWDAAARRGTGAVVMAGERVFRVAPSNASVVRPLSREGMRLVAVTGTKQAEWSIDPVDVEVPPGAVTLASVDDQLLIGTRELGTARYRDGDQRPRDWLRRRQMFLEATALSVACAQVNDCWLATGTKQAWHWNGDRFTPRGPDDIALAIVRDPAGPLFAVHRAEGDPAIRLSRIENGRWKELPKVALTTASDEPSISFARFASPNTLWIGLRDRENGEWRSHGIAIVDVASGRVTVHRPGEKGKLPVPASVISADVRGDSAWFAMADGVARLSGGKLDIWTDEALRGVRALAIVEGGVIAATPNGALRWDGKSWETPPPLGFAVDDIVATRSGQVWMATDRGIAVWDGTRVRRVDTRRGLAEDRTLDLAVDQFDRVWARGPGSLALISQ
ncbi:MAG: hypothetical protein H0V17_36180 [Deltaproteobacteria bacterium]|nr:hypothetical protein [Deltaproteobacteria bacterium]